MNRCLRRILNRITNDTPIKTKGNYVGLGTHYARRATASIANLWGREVRTAKRWNLQKDGRRSRWEEDGREGAGQGVQWRAFVAAVRPPRHNAGLVTNARKFLRILKCRL